MNASDEKAIKNIEERGELSRKGELKDIRDVLSTPQGRRLVWRILGWTGCEGTPKRSTSELTYMAIGSGDVGRWLKSEVVEAGEELLLQMMKDNMGDKDGKPR